jgi:Putative amidase domain
MLAGGWPIIEGGKHNSNAWWSDDESSSNTWASAQWFYWFLNNSPRVSECTINDLDIGDIVMMKIPEADYPDHAIVVTNLLSASDGVEIYLSYHSTDNQNRLLQDIQ